MIVFYMLQVIVCHDYQDPDSCVWRDQPPAYRRESDCWQAARAWKNQHGTAATCTPDVHRNP